jgi:mono/diheme cytochrome c family protein
MPLNLKTTSAIVLGLTALSGAMARAISLETPARPAAAADAARVARGAYLVSAMGCHDCHTPFKLGPQGPEPDMSRALTGHPQGLVMPTPPALPKGPWSWLGADTNTAFAGAWGVSFTANLTPDPETGLGKWTEDIFIATIRTGRHEGKGRPVLPPMPWPMIRNLNDEDLGAIFAYLRSLPPVKNRVPAPVDPPEGPQ